MISLFWLSNYYQEYSSISRLRLIHITASQANPSHFTVLVRSIPWSPEESYSETVRKFFSNYHASTYLSHQMIYRSGTVQKLLVCIYEYIILFNSFTIHHQFYFGSLDVFSNSCSLHAFMFIFSITIWVQTI